MKMMKWMQYALAAAIAAGPAAPSHAEDYPSRPIRIVSPFAPGGFNDVLARMIGQKMAADFGQPVVVDNRPGANMIIGSELVAKADPDGYTLLMAAVPHVINPSLYKLPYDSEKDFTPTALITLVPNVLVVHPSLPVHSVQELIAYGKAHPDKLSFGSVGTGSSYHMAGELFKNMTGIEMLHVPYKGSAPAMNDLLAGRFNVFFANLVSVLPHIRSGKLRALGVTSPKRAAIMPELPTVAEAGVPGFSASSWYGLMGPANMPPEVVAKINAEVGKIVSSPEMRQWLTKDGAEPLTASPQEFAQLVHDDIARWGKVVRERGIKADQ
ncbi:tripartite tricarboxylate transporter substrate binding protein [Pigmentiphaga soli]|uniref:Tripartite tricarboxylate transporter substrate binding protein n=1 Tax=Pigmentiphaga soli TaxID=1007095 RepID=A0ABP8HHG2_9BURK